MKRTAKSPKAGSDGHTRLLYATVSRTWSPWTGSGFGVRLAKELEARDRLHGAVWPGMRSQKELRRPSAMFPLTSRIRRALGRSESAPPWESENEGVLGDVLRAMPPGSPVMYHFLKPTQDLSIPIRRFYFLDITTRDAVRTASYGHGGWSDEDVRRSVERHKEILANAEGVMTFSTYGADSIAAEYGYPRDRITAIGSGPVRVFDDEPDLSLERFRRGEILFVGRNWERKGGPKLLDAFREVRKSLPHVTLTVLGAKIEPTGDPGVRFLGLVPDEEVRRCFASASLFCMPAVCETWGIVYGEAAWSGLPIAGFDAWAMPDIVEHGVSGLLTKRMDAGGLAEILTTMLSDPERLQAMARAAVQRGRNVLGWPQVLERLTWRVWPEALGGRKPVFMKGDR